MNAAEWANKQYYDKQYQHCIDMAFPSQRDPDVLFYAALSLDQLDKKKDAVAMLRRTLFHKPDHEGALRSLAWSEADDLERISVLEKMARKGICEADDYCLMGSVYNKINRLNEAHHWFSVALQKEPKNSLALLGIAEVHVKLAIRYVQETEDTEDIDLSQQMSDEWDAEEVMRFIFDNVTKKAAERRAEEDEQEEFRRREEEFYFQA